MSFSPVYVPTPCMSPHSFPYSLCFMYSPYRIYFTPLCMSPLCLCSLFLYVPVPSVSPFQVMSSVRVCFLSVYIFSQCNSRPCTSFYHVYPSLVYVPTPHMSPLRSVSPPCNLSVIPARIICLACMSLVYIPTPYVYLSLVCNLSVICPLSACVSYPSMSPLRICSISVVGLFSRYSFSFLSAVFVPYSLLILRSTLLCVSTLNVPPLVVCFFSMYPFSLLLA